MSRSMPFGGWPPFIVVAAALLVGCGRNEPPQTAKNTNTGARASAVTVSEDEAKREPAAGRLPEKVADERLHNAVRLHEKVISGAQPDEAAFQALQELGVKTIISVDGAKPDLEMAHRYGMRYVHLPHGYDGIPEERARELAKAVRDLDGPLFIHCHHGKHRSPTAAAVACVSAGLLDPSQSLDVLRMAGTSDNYRGLYDSAEAAARLDDALLDALVVEFKETVDLPPMADAMVGVEHTHDQLTEIKQAGWLSPPLHPDLEPAHEALLLREHFTELLRTEDVLAQPAEFQQLLRESETAAQQLEDALRGWTTNRAANPLAAPPEALGDSLETITRHCKTCHQKFRDVPLSDKRKSE